MPSASQQFWDKASLSWIGEFAPALIAFILVDTLANRIRSRHLAFGTRWLGIAVAEMLLGVVVGAVAKSMRPDPVDWWCWFAYGNPFILGLGGLKVGLALGLIVAWYRALQPIRKIDNRQSEIGNHT